HAGCETAPTRMRGGDGLAVPGTEEHWQAIRGEYRQHRARRCSHGSVRLWFVTWRRLSAVDDPTAMHLPQPLWRGRQLQGGLHGAAVGLHDGDVLAAVEAEVAARVRCLRLAGTAACGDGGVHLRRHWPVREEPGFGHDGRLGPGAKVMSDHRMPAGADVRDGRVGLLRPLWDSGFPG